MTGDELREVPVLADDEQLQVCLNSVEVLIERFPEHARPIVLAVARLHREMLARRAKPMAVLANVWSPAGGDLVSALLPAAAAGAALDGEVRAAVVFWREAFAMLGVAAEDGL